ncbi:MAG: ABC transporter ATP-binding protein, partial [Cetobacterium sp.]
GIFQNIANLVSEAVIMLLLYVAMLYVNWRLTLSMTLFLGLNVVIIKYSVLETTKRLGKIREGRSREFYKIVSSVFSNYKFVKLQGNHDSIQKNYDDALEKNDEIGIKQSILTPVPKSMLEFSGFFMIVTIVLFSILKYGEDGMGHILPIVSLFFLSLYRMLPSIIRIVGIFQSFAFTAPVPGRIKEELSYEVENLGVEKVTFESEIKIKDLKFQYKKDNLILNGVSLSIKKGDSVAFIGESGSGKTTLVDILMGLYKPLSGTVEVDGAEINNSNLKSWRERIGYIPQEIYLFDGTVGENVAFGDSYDEERVIKVLEAAKIWKFLKEKQGVHTKVGDAGVMLSGGQKQRIGIARALYKDPEILVLDEATSALDDNTEREIMDEMYNLSSGKTLIMIAHRLSSLRRCNKIYELERGILKKEYSNIGEVSR